MPPETPTPLTDVIAELQPQVATLRHVAGELLNLNEHREQLEGVGEAVRACMDAYHLPVGQILENFSKLVDAIDRMDTSNRQLFNRSQVGSVIAVLKQIGLVAIDRGYQPAKDDIAVTLGLLTTLYEALPEQPPVTTAPTIHVPLADKDGMLRD